MITAVQKRKWKHQMQTEEKMDEVSVGFENCKSLKQYHYPR